MQRRLFLKSTVATAASIPLQALLSRVEAGGGLPRSADYGPLVPVLDETTGLPLLHLPEGFRYVSFGWTGDPMTNGAPTPGVHDGMAAYEGANGVVRLVRNHEQGRGPAFSTVSYDPAAAGGTTTIEFNGVTGQYVSTQDSLSGTIRNCAGGPTPWGSWLTCEETNDFTTMPHGYVFDVPAVGHGNPEPIRDMGRFSHEAVAVDPASNTVYLTEDTGTTSGFYKFVPTTASDITAGGRLYMLKIAGEWQKNMYTGYPNNSHFPTEWVAIDTPDNPSPSSPSTWVSGQGRAKGAAHFGRLEGAWYDPKGDIYFVSTNGGAVGQGQIWQYNLAKGFLRLVFESPSATVLNAPDNITVSPRGGLVLCEDGSGTEFIHGLTRKGEIFKFAQNNVVLNGERNGITGNFSGSEFAGACYSPDGKWLFFNVQSPGITFAVTGPWREGAL